MGRSIMVSDFLCECHGPLAIKEGDKIIRRARRTIFPGKNHGGYWKNSDLIEQLTEAMDIFKILHPDCQALFAFDNSQNHNAFADDALVASRLNRSNGGKNVKLMRDGYFGNPRQVQSMQTVEKGEVVQRGLDEILSERQLPFAGLKRKCVGSCTTESCCMVSLLQAQEDFAAQLSWLEETVRAAGHEFILFPKFHCELSFIELFWGEAKRIARANCDYTFKSLQENLDGYLDSIPVERIRKYARYCYRYMGAYRGELPPILAAYAVKKYRSHRMIPNPQDIQAMFDSEQSKSKNRNRHTLSAK